jgi:hypothetical protein
MDITIALSFSFSLSSFPNENLDHHHMSNTATFGLQLLHHLDWCLTYLMIT